MAEKGVSHTEQVQVITQVISNLNPYILPIRHYLNDCGSAEVNEGFGLLRGHHCGSIGESKFRHGIPIPPDPAEQEGEQEEEEEATSDEDRRMNPRDEARIMARLTPQEINPGEVAAPVRPYEGGINVFGPPRPLEGLDGHSEDWWDLQ